MILEEYVIEHLKVIKTTFNAEFLNEIKKQGNIADRVSNGGKILFAVSVAVQLIASISLQSLFQNWKLIELPYLH